MMIPGVKFKIVSQLKISVSTLKFWVWLGFSKSQGGPKICSNDSAAMTDLFELSKDGNIIPKKCVNRDKCDFATKQRMFGVFPIDEILRYRGI